MKELIEALQILLKYADDGSWPTHCEHDVLYVYAGIEYGYITSEDLISLEELGFEWDRTLECFKSYRFGSC